MNNPINKRIYGIYIKIFISEKEEESIEAENVLLASNQKKCEILNDESVAIRAEFVQIESAISRQDSVQKENELLAAHTENNRQETLKLIAELRILNENVINERDRIQTTCDENKAVSLIYAEKKDLLINLIKEKLKNEKANAMKDLDMQKKLHELKLAIAKQDGELEKAKEELAGLKSRDFVFESVGELRNKISVMESEVKSQDRKIKEFVKKNVKLTEQIAFLQPPAPPSTPNASRAAAAVATNQVLDTTVDMETDIGEKMTQPYWPGVPRAAIELTPIPFKHMSIDVITGHPLMTSTPRQQPAGIQRPPSGTPMPSPVPNKS
uniref:Uncharacterized protein n=1 Tax=Caenorhabditis japonica TaxID=281687 RepID=A0A8R1DPI4_CAEJA